MSKEKTPDRIGTRSPVLPQVPLGQRRTDLPDRLIGSKLGHVCDVNLSAKSHETGYESKFSREAALLSS